MFSNLKVINLTQLLTPSAPSWEGTCGFICSNTVDYNECDTDPKFRIQELQLLAGIGTHIDAPAHAFPNALTVDQIPLEQLISPCVVINLSNKSDTYFKVTTNDIKDFENRYGKLPENSFVIFYTGWDRYWKTPELYINKHKFPYLSESVALLLLERKIAGIGIDTLSPDLPGKSFPVHKHILGAGKYIIENVANAGSLPPIGSHTLALPLLFKESTEAPVRLIALV